MKIDLDINKEYKETTVIIKAPSFTNDVQSLMKRIETAKKGTLIGKYHNKIVPLKPDDIVCFFTRGQKVMAATKSITYEVKDKLYELEEKYKHLSFIRISKSAIANIDKIKDIEVAFNGSLVVNFIGDKQEIISRRYVPKVKKYLGIGGKK